jgi:hypothetical protein
VRGVAHGTKHQAGGLASRSLPATDARVMRSKIGASREHMKRVPMRHAVMDIAEVRRTDR